MKISKKAFIKLIVIGSALQIATTGCEHINNFLVPGTDKFEKIQYVVEQGVAFGARAYISSLDEDKKDKAINYFNIAGSVIEQLIATGEIEPDIVNETITERINGIIEVPYNVAITTALKVALKGYNKFYSLNVKDNITNAPKAIALLQSIANGIYLGVDPVSSGSDTDPLDGYDDWSL